MRKIKTLFSEAQVDRSVANGRLNGKGVFAAVSTSAPPLCHQCEYRNCNLSAWIAMNLMPKQ